MKNTVIEKARQILDLPHCCPELKDACRVWLDAVGTDGEKAAAEALVAELKEDVMHVEDVIAFFESEDAVAKFGAEMAGNIAGHAKEIQAAGAVYCDCDACALGAFILENQAAIL